MAHPEEEFGVLCHHLLSGVGSRKSVAYVSNIPPELALAFSIWLRRSWFRLRMRAQVSQDLKQRISSPEAFTDQPWSDERFEIKMLKEEWFLYSLLPAQQVQRYVAMVVFCCAKHVSIPATCWCKVQRLSVRPNWLFNLSLRDKVQHILIWSQPLAFHVVAVAVRFRSGAAKGASWCNNSFRLASRCNNGVAKKRRLQSCWPWRVSFRLSSNCFISLACCLIVDLIHLIDCCNSTASEHCALQIHFFLQKEWSAPKFHFIADFSCELFSFRPT